MLRTEMLTNGLVRVEDRRSGLTCLLTLDGEHRSGSGLVLSPGKRFALVLPYAQEAARRARAARKVVTR